MARFILIDNCSGYIFGDTADIGIGYGDEWTPELVAEAIAADLGCDCGFVGYNPIGTNPGYLVYRADVGDSIDAVKEICEFVGFVRVHEAT